MENFNWFITDLSRLISIQTEKSTPTPTAPFGENIKLALNAFLELAQKMGFTTKNYDQYMGEISLGEGQEIGIIGHLDVVPAGNGWSTPPYTLTKIGNAYYGRGVADDKAPLLLALYALKALKDSGEKINKKFRLFVGCDEESGWQDVEYFSKNYSFPEYGFSPDGNFPVTYAEKGITIVKFSLPKLKNFSKLSGGTVVNAVCGYASCLATPSGINLELLSKHGLTLTGNKIESVGKSAHGSRPELGVNATKALFNYFLDMGEDVQNIVDYIFNDKAGLFNRENEQGKLTLSAGLLSEDEQKITITCDMRIPAPMTFAEIKPLLDGFNIPYQASEKHPPVMVEKEGWFVNALLSAYNSVTGQKASAKAMGGSTFARAFNKGCSFGIELPGCSNGIHEPNERITENELKTAYKIYKTALFNLNK